MSKDNRGSSAHANGGAAEVKKALFLAARHRFFGQAPKKWGRKAGQAIDPTHVSRTRTKQRQGSTLFALCTCAPFPWAKAAAPCCPFHPISLLLRKETGWSPKETRFWVPPRQLSVPPASPTNSKPQHSSRLPQADLSARSTHQSPRPSRAKMSKDNRGSSAHANGGATKVKKGAFLWRLDTVSLGKHQRNGVERQDKPKPPPNVSAHT